MPANMSEIIDPKDQATLAEAILEEANAGHEQSAWRHADKMRSAQRHQTDVATVLVRLVSKGCFSPENAFILLTEIKEAHSRDPKVLGLLGDSLDAVIDIDDLNRPAPEEPMFYEVVDRLEELVSEFQGTDDEQHLLTGLSTAARLLGRQRDDVAERSYQKLVEMEPERSSAHYNLGLFYKTRGRFKEGMSSNQQAAQLSAEEVDSYEWNTGICATGARDAIVALDVWQRMGQKISMGRFGLPEGQYSQTKVKLAQRPLAERSAENDDPGLEETIWIERLSPCHGIVRSVLYQDLGVDYGDVILIDGAPITYHKYGDDEVPVFPHLATLEHRGYQYYDFAGTQKTSRQLEEISGDLPSDAVVYSHTESFRQICATCWRDPDLDHERHETMERHVVTGRVAAPSDIEPAELLTMLDTAVEARPGCRIFIPDLAKATRNLERADVDTRRFNMLTAD